MNWAAIAAVISALGFLATVTIAPFYYGKLTQQTLDNSKRIDRHDEVLGYHGNRLSLNEAAIEGLRQWNDGYNCASTEKQKK